MNFSFFLGWILWFSYDFQTSKGHGVPPARWPPSASLPAPALGGAALVSREAAHAGASKAMDVGCWAMKIPGFGVPPRNLGVKPWFPSVSTQFGVFTLGVKLRVVLDQGAPSGFWPFSRKFSHKIALVRCPCAFRLRRLAQSLRRGFCFILRRGIFPVNSSIKWLFWDVHVHFDCAGLRKV